MTRQEAAAHLAIHRPDLKLADDFVEVAEFAPKTKLTLAQRIERIRALRERNPELYNPKPTDFGFAPDDTRHFANWWNNEPDPDYSLDPVTNDN